MLTKERKQELRLLLEEAMGSLVVQYENSPRDIPVPVYRLYLEERWAYYGIDFLLQAFSVQFRLNVANRHTQLKLRAFIRDELASFIENEPSTDFNLVCVKNAAYCIEGDLTDARRVYGSRLDDLPLFMLIERLLEFVLVRGAEEAVSIFDRYSRGAGTHAFLRVIPLLEGIKLKSKIEVYPGARLVPLPSPEISGKMEQCLTGLPMKAFVNEKDSFFGRVLLVIDCPGLSIFHKPSERVIQDGTHIEELAFPVQIPEVEFTTREAAHSFKDIFRQALSLVCNFAIETVFEAWLFEQDKSFIRHLSGSNMLRYANRSNTSTEVGEAEIDEAKRLYRILEGKPDLRERLQIPIDRWIMSKTSKRDIDKIIDLGIAFEALYLPDGDERTELSFRFRLRAAWYLGTDKKDRDEYLEKFKAVYICRSKAVHRGKLKPTVKIGEESVPTSEFIEIAQELCRNTILKMLVKQKFPDKDYWDSLILGGEVEEGSN